MQFGEFGKKYLLLGLRIGKLIDGYIDAYYGPPELKNMVDKESTQSPKKLLTACKDLQKKLSHQEFVDERVKFLGKILRAMETSLEFLNGKKIPYLEQVYRIYDIKPELTDDSVFYNLTNMLDNLYEGPGSLAERLDTIQKKRDVSENKIEITFRRATEIVREQSKKLFPGLLPDGEEFAINLVKNEPWGAYNWYLGNFKSKIDVNTDIPNDWAKILLTAAHEGYPGHHMEHAVKEKLLYIEEQRFEHCILLVPTPEAVISEGLANTGLDVLFSPQEIAKISLEELCLDPKDEYSLDKLVAEREAIKKAYALLNNIAILAHVEEWSDDQLIKYVLNFGLITKKRLKQHLIFIHHPLWSTYVFNYFIGEMMIKKKFGQRPSPEDFKMLLTRPILPSDLL
ncbi:MAG: hypothetical protein ACFFA6_11265 [Promethearchaeota archaeon]